MKLNLFCAAVTLFLAGYLVGEKKTTVKAQEAIPTEGAWEVHDGALSYPSGGLYVIKHNRVTGETLVLTIRGLASKDDKWLLLGESDLRNTK